MHGDRISAARRAAAEAIAQLRDGVAFAVIAGTATAEQVYPTTGTATATGRTRAEATAEVQRLRADGATAIGTWLTLAGQIADRTARSPGRRGTPSCSPTARTANGPAVFQPALDAVVGRFTCDCRGVGTDWRVDELRTIASALLGTRRHRRRSRRPRRRLPGAHGRRDGEDHGRPGPAALDAAHGAAVRFVKQVAPTIEDLTAPPHRVRQPAR